MPIDLNILEDAIRRIRNTAYDNRDIGSIELELYVEQYAPVIDTPEGPVVDRFSEDKAFGSKHFMIRLTLPPAQPVPEGYEMIPKIDTSNAGGVIHIDEDEE